MLRQKIVARRQELLEMLGAGVSDLAYRQTVGQLQGLNEALKLSDDVDFEINGG